MKKMEQQRIEKMLKHIIPENGPIRLDLISPKLLEKIWSEFYNEPLVCMPVSNPKKRREPLVCVSASYPITRHEPLVCIAMKEEEEHQIPITKENSTVDDEDLYN